MRKRKSLAALKMPSAFATLALVSLAALSVWGCRGSEVGGTTAGAASAQPSATAVAIGEGSAPVMSATPAPAPAAPQPPKVAGCAVVPMKLRSSMGGKNTLLWELRSDGTIHSPMFMMVRTEVNMSHDKRGCVVRDGSVVADRTNPEQIWTKRQKLRVEGNKLWVTDKRWLAIADDGSVSDPSGPEHSFMKFEGYQPEGLCAAQLMLANYLGTMPSMAVVDGVAELLDAPKDSVCPELHK